MKTEFTSNRKLVIIGNGFDLAHGLKTGYHDFLLSYFNASLKKFLSQSWFKDDLIEVITEVNNEIQFGSLIDVKGQSDVIKFKSYLLKSLVMSSSNRWVDVEGEFYDLLKKEFHKFSNGGYINYNIPESIHKSVNRTEIKRINKDFALIKSELENYLGTVTPSYFQKKRSIAIIMDKIYNSIKDIDEENKSTPVQIVNFNYTNIFEKYREPWMDVNYIHGQLKNESNPMIFGYGDESDSFYSQIESENMNEYLTHFKSFGYFKNSNYRKLLSFIDSDKFDVIVLGHSCGLSDGVMLKTIFEHVHCETIQTFFYENENLADGNDYFERTIEISRHFSDKSLMRKKLVSFDKSDPF